MSLTVRIRSTFAKNVFTAGVRKFVVNKVLQIGKHDMVLYHI